MAKYGPDDIVVEFDSTDGGSLADMSQYVDEIDGIDKEALTEQSDTFGDSWEEHLAVGVNKVNPITIKGKYDDTVTTGPHAVFNSIGSTRTLKLTWGNSKTTSVETLIQNYKRLSKRGELTKYEVVLLPTGAPTEA